MSEELIPRQSRLAETKEESLTRQFYEWEMRGRGWKVNGYPVELEPPFRPMLILDPSSDNIVDDGRKHTFVSRLFSRQLSPTLPTRPCPTDAEYLEKLAEFDEPVLCGYLEEDFREVQVILPSDYRVALPVAEQLLLSLSHSHFPISFEVIGTREQTQVQFAATEVDYAPLKQQLKSYFPGCLLQESYNLLSNEWESRNVDEVIVDFGLSNEFMIPINALHNFDIDPLIAIAGAFSNLDVKEVGVFQVMFQKTRNKWSEEIMDSVRFFDGTPFFSNAPDMIPLAKQKISSPMFAAAVRVAAKSYNQERCLQIARNIASGLSQLASPTGNELIPLSNGGYDRAYHEQALLRRVTFRCGMLLNSHELVSLVHPPSPVVRSERLVRHEEKTKELPHLVTGHQLVLGNNTHQNKTALVTLSNDQRTRHLHLIGTSGSGKSTLLLSLIEQDLQRNQGLCVIDPHGDLIDAVIENMPEDRLKDVILFDPSDAEYPIGFNILHAKTQLEKTILSSDLVAMFRRMSTSWGDVMDSVLSNAILAFIESSRGGTLFELKRFLVEKDYREKYLESVTDDGVTYFWNNEFPLITGRPQASILIRLDAFLRHGLLRNIVCQKENRLDFRSIMDDRKVLLIKLSQGLIGEENAYLLGTMLVSRLYQAALGRQDSKDRPHFWLYLDEFHHFITPSMERVLSGTRKYNLGLILAHQEFRQMQSRSQEVASSVLSNCYTRICFRLGDADADKFAGGFSFFDAKALQNLGVGEAIARVERAEYDFNLSVSQVGTVTNEVAKTRKERIQEFSRSSFGSPRAEVEAQLCTTRERAPNRATEAKTQGPRIAADVVAPTQRGKTIEQPQPANANEHQYLQKIVKRIAENYGFIATVEKQVFGGAGRIDVALENGAIKIACEVAVTNTVDYEVQNVQKCLSSGYDQVIVLSVNEQHLNEIERAAASTIGAGHIRKVAFLKPDDFHLYLERLGSDNPEVSGDPKVKGYEVHNSHADVTPSAAELIMETIVEILETEASK